MTKCNVCGDNHDETTHIPEGLYCYDVNDKGEYRVCPFWSLDPEKPFQNNGYCNYLKKGDWENEDSFGLLFDKVKECGI